MRAGICRSTLIALLSLGACSFPGASHPPADFLLILDAKSAHGIADHVNVRIDAAGTGRYERYETAGVIRGDTSGMVTYAPDQIVDAGEFRVGRAALDELWQAIDAARFFELDGDYRMALGHSYAFIVVEAAGRRGHVWNVGMEVPEVAAIVEATDRVLPDGIDLEYPAGLERGRSRE